jgi:hypothetical protein
LLPPWIDAIRSTEYGKRSGKKERPHQWLLGDDQFRTLLHGYICASKNARPRSQKSVCSEWLNRDGDDMSYESLKAKDDEPPLPEDLDKALSEAGKPFIPLPERKWPKKRTSRIDRAIATRQKTNKPYYFRRP